MATFAYCRVSTKEQISDNQQLEIERAGHTVDYWFADIISWKTCAGQHPRLLRGSVKFETAKPLLYSSSTDWDEMILQTLTVLAEMEHDLLVERTQTGLGHAKSEGEIGSAVQNDNRAA